LGCGVKEGYLIIDAVGGKGRADEDVVNRKEGGFLGAMPAR